MKNPGAWRGSLPLRCRCWFWQKAQSYIACTIPLPRRKRKGIYCLHPLLLALLGTIIPPPSNPPRWALTGHLIEYGWTEAQSNILAETKNEQGKLIFARRLSYG
ncbi:hypothetical protein RND71_019298 [Anisodus tanguticus]|uniref:Uncharacterized protein n=1 Tax=Anisodus tanguticus TaxID=243964 RepID=A0AAE1RYU4_9SOLA|nr:hypothetical protein RND71_019298 [Anisodus tanguticus]